jgi:integrase
VAPEAVGSNPIRLPWEVDNNSSSVHSEGLFLCLGVFKRTPIVHQNTKSTPAYISFKCRLVYIVVYSTPKIHQVHLTMNIVKNSRGYHYLRITVDGQRKQISLGKDPEIAQTKAQQFLKQSEEKVVKRKNENINEFFIELYDKYMHLQGIKKSSTSSKNTHIRRLMDWLEANDLYVTNVDVEVAYRFMANELNETSNYTWNNNLTTYNEFFKMIVMRGYLNANPFDELKRRPKVDTEYKKLSQQQQQAILNFDSFNHEFFKTMLLTGMRANDLWNTPSKNINIDTKNITYKVTKSPSGKSVTIPIDDVVANLLRPLLKKEFPFEDLHSSDHRKKVLYVFKVIVKDRRATHDWCRHTFAANKLKEQIPLVALRDLLGHESVTQTEQYAKKLDPDYLRRYI